MRIEEIDKNFAKKDVEISGDVATYNLPSLPFDVYGVKYDKDVGFFRMPKEIADNVSSGVSCLNLNTAGGRIRFSTNSKFIKIEVTYNTFCAMSHMALTGSGGFVLLDETDEDKELVAVFRPDYSNSKGYFGSCDLQGDKIRFYEFYMPLYNDVTSLKITLDKDAYVGGGKKYEDVLPILYYGSSITQGGCASRTDNSYQSFIEKRTNIDYINLGFSGNAKAEDVMVDYLTTIDCSVFVCDYDCNSPSVEHLENTHYRLYERYRKIRPDTPIVFITMPVLRDIRRTEIIKSTYEKALSLGDKNVYYIDGREFFGEDKKFCTVDGCHPTDWGFYRMSVTIERVLRKILKI